MDDLIDRRSKSLWMEVAVAPNAIPLQGNTECDVAIIGAGIAGISTAYELAMEGSRVVVVDRGKIAGGITARTTAHLAPLCDDLNSAMINLRGEEMSRLFYESQAAALPPALEFVRDLLGLPLSRISFAIDGTPLNAPAIGPLAEVGVRDFT